MSRRRGPEAPWARLSEQDGKIIEVFAPRRRKIIGPAPGENPQPRTHIHTRAHTTHSHSAESTSRENCSPASLHL